MRFLTRLLLPALLLATPAASGLGLPAPGPVTLPRLPVDVPDSLRQPLDQATSNLRQVRIRGLLREHRRWLDTDPAGAPVVRGEVVAIAPTPAALAHARAAGFSIARETELAGLGLRVVVLRAPERQRLATALRKLRRLDPDGRYDYNHLYLGSGATAVTTTAAAPGGAIPAPSTVATPAAPLRVGLVDSGVDRRHPSLAGVQIEHWGCDGQAHPHRHGTAVASLLAGRRKDSAATGTQLYAADIYCSQPTGGALTGLAQAMAWLARERVTVINISLVGPPNRLLEQVVQLMLERGHVLVAAVGNDGPAAPPLYPAAYPGVIGVTAVDPRDRPLPEAGRGQHVDFAAPGAGLFAAAPDGGWWQVRGTSFAAPLVARLTAREVGASTGSPIETVLARLTALAHDAGPPGRDNRYGHGLLDTQARAAWAAPMNEE